MLSESRANGTVNCIAVVLVCLVPIASMAVSNVTTVSTSCGFLETSNLVLLGADFTFPNNKNNNNNNKNNSHLVFHGREGTRGMKFVTHTYLTMISSA